MATDNDPNADINDLGLPPLAPLASEPTDTPPRTRRGKRAQVPAHESQHDAAEEDERIARLLEDDENSGAQIEVSRKLPNNKWAICCAFPLTDWSSEAKIQVANEFGGGTYRAAIRRSDKTFAATFFFDVDPSLKPKTKADAPAPAFDMQAMLAQLKPQGGDMQVMQMMQSQQAMMMQFMQMQAQQSAENMKALVSIMARPVTPSAPVNDKLMELLMVKAFSDKPAMDLPRIIESVAKLRTIANGGEVGDEGEESESDVFGSVIKALPGLMGLIGQGMATHRATQAPAPQPAQIQAARPQARPADNPPAETRLAPTPAPAPAPEVNTGALAMFLPQVVQFAEADNTPEAAASSIREVLQPDQLESLLTLLRSDNWLNILIDACRPVMKWTRWFAALRETLLNPQPETPAPATDVEVMPG